MNNEASPIARVFPAVRVEPEVVEQLHSVYFTPQTLDGSDELPFAAQPLRIKPRLIYFLFQKAPLLAFVFWGELLPNVGINDGRRLFL